MSKLVFASVISEIQQSDIFMTVKARICEAPAANLNGARVTEAFIDEIVGNEERYVGLPLYADVKALTSGNYRRLGHLYDSKTGEFHSTQIGSFYQFEKEEFETTVGEEKKTGCYLVGYARIAKRNKKLSKAISELFTEGALKFSFEVSVGEYEELDDNTILIDASESNYLEGTAIVTFPACEEAVALELVAQRKEDDQEGGMKEMAENEKKIEAEAEIEEVKVEAAAEDETKAETKAEAKTEEVKAEEEKPEEENAEKDSEEEDTSCKKKEKAEEEATETAAVVVTEGHREEHVTYAYDTENGTDVSQRVTIETSVSHVDPDAQIVETDDGVHIAEEGGEGGDTPAQTDPPAGDTPAQTEPVTGNDPPAGNTPAEETPAEVEEAPVTDSVDSKKKTAEQMFAEMVEQIAQLRSEIEELKAAKVTAEAKTITAEVNPFVDDINSNGKYSLLQKVSTRNTSSYSLLSRA